MPPIMNSSTKGETPMNQLCDSCQTPLTDDVDIYIWAKGDEERTICEECHSWEENSFRTQGWVEQGDEDE